MFLLKKKNIKNILHLLNQEGPVDAGPQFLISLLLYPPPPPNPAPLSFPVLTYELLRPTVLRPELNEVARLLFNRAAELFPLYCPDLEGAKKEDFGVFG